MEFLTAQLNGENGSAIQLVLITIALAILLIVIVWIFKKLTGSAARRANRSRVPRLSITDSTIVDEKRYLVMVRRDNIEHLLLIGGANDLVVETNIVRAQQPASAPAQAAPQSQAAQEPTARAIVKEPEVAKAAPASIAAPAAVATGVAGLAAMASSTANAAADVASSTSQVIADTATSSVEVVTDTVSDVASSAVETVSNTVSDTITSAAVEPSIEIVEPAVGVEAPALESDLENAISAKLDDALSGDAFEVETTAETKVDSDDEMQRLLDELSGEAKEPA